MFNKFDDDICNKYGNDLLQKMCNANFKLVPESYILRMKSALALQCPPCEGGCFHYFFGLDVSEMALIRKSKNPLDDLFQQLKGVYLQSCDNVCMNPDNHFRKYSRENRCFPIYKVYEGLQELCQNAANQLLDRGLVDDVIIQIKNAEKKANLLVYRIVRNKLEDCNIIIKKWLIRDFKILVVDFDALNVSETRIESPEDDTFQSKFQNLTDNIGKNFTFRLVPKPSSERERWEEFVDNQMKYDADVIISVIYGNVQEALCRWKRILIGHNQVDSLNDEILGYEQHQMDDNEKCKFHMYKKISASDKMKIAVLFNDDSMGNLIKIFPLTFILPREMKKLLFMLEEIRKEG